MGSESIFIFGNLPVTLKKKRVLLNICTCVRVFKRKIMDNAQRDIQNAVTEMVEDLDTNYIRKLQVQMYRCSVDCCEDERNDMMQVQNCLDRCSEPVMRAQNMFQQELQNFQDRIQRCASTCADSFRDKLPVNATQSDVAKNRHILDDCVSKCAEEHINVIPSLKSRLEGMLSNYQ